MLRVRRVAPPASTMLRTDLLNERAPAASASEPRCRGSGTLNSSWLPFSPSFGLSAKPEASHAYSQEKAPQTQVLQLQKRGRKGGGKAEDASPQIPKGAALTGSLDRQSGPSSYSEGHRVSPGMSGEQERAICLFLSPGRQRGVPPTDHLTGSGEKCWE